MATPSPRSALDSPQCSTTTGCLQRCATCSVALPTKNALIAPMACFFMTCMYDRVSLKRTCLEKLVRNHEKGRLTLQMCCIEARVLLMQPLHSNTVMQTSAIISASELS